MPQNRNWLDSDRADNMDYHPPYVLMNVGSQEVHLPISPTVNVVNQLESYEDTGGIILQQKSDGGVELLETEGGRGDERGKFKSLKYISSAGEKVGADRAYKQGTWSVAESKVLFDAKKRERDYLSGLSKKSSNADERWKAIAEFCWSHGVQRSKDQCKFKWENWLPEFRKVRAFEKDRSPEMKSYFEMEKTERRAWHLPQNIDKELYWIVQSILDVKYIGRVEIRGSRMAAECSGADREEAFGTDILTKDSVDGHSNGDKSDRAEDATMEMENLCQEETGRKEEAWCENLRTRDRADLDEALKILEMHNSANVKRRKLDGADTLRVIENENFPRVLMTKRDGGCYSSDEKRSELMLGLEDRKDARHKEMMTVERENLAAIASVASALNSVASAFQKLAEHFIHH
ncbi:hypothetical protein O6H91_06G005100 [Diphasiastrum complanatum]|uniref:Uncharacterized protein n=1 Tax=Diphasiastrum complanatum TaxID=34168 RepID=A0ACC2DAC0_DIPCM|nr:hypothetical protein O6H91_06G005100 [Diphasiastrum complanatum]